MDDPRLLALGLGTFHTLAFFVPVVLLLHLSGGLDGLLVLGTWGGIAVFLAFWALTTGCTIGALHQVAHGRHPFPAAAAYGALEGALLVLLPALVIAVIESPTVFFGVPLAMLFGMAAGALIGTLFAVIDLLLLPSGFVRPPASTMGASDGAHDAAAAASAPADDPNPPPPSP